MMAAALLLLMAAAPGDAAPAAVTAEQQSLMAAALHAGRADEELRVELLAHDVRARGCTFDAAEVTEPVEASGVIPVRLSGADRDGLPCAATASATVRVHAPAVRVKNAVARGATLTSADVEVIEAELRRGSAAPATRLRALPGQARASRPLPRGTWLRATDLEVGPRLGDAIRVSVRSGALTVEEPGRVAACPGGASGSGGELRACASLKGGRRVAGAIDPMSGALVVEVRR